MRNENGWIYPIIIRIDEYIVELQQIASFTSTAFRSNEQPIYQIWNPYREMQEVPGSPSKPLTSSGPSYSMHHFPSCHISQQESTWNKKQQDLSADRTVSLLPAGVPQVISFFYFYFYFATISGFLFAETLRYIIYVVLLYTIQLIAQHSALGQRI